MSPTGILGILLLLSLAGNAWQYNKHTEDSVKFGTVKQLSDDIGASAKACSDGVENLDKDAKRRQTEILTALDSAKGRITGLQHDALDALKAKPADPADLCKSLETYWKAQIAKERAGK